jgi:DNA-binding LacI/PurR family transcriptional regulator
LVLGRIRNLIETDKYRCVLAAGHGETEEQFRNSTSLFDMATLKQTLGIICFEGNAHLDLCREMEIPVIYSTSAIAPEGEHCVFLDYEQMLIQGISLLNEKGLDDFVLIAMSGPEEEFELEHENSLRNLVHGIPGLPSERVVWLPWGGYSCEGIYSSFRAWWEGLDRKPRALFFMDDAVCDVALRVITELGIEVPKELAILTQAVVNRTFAFPVSLSCLEFNPDDVCDMMWQMLSDLIDRRDGYKGIRQVKIPAVFRAGDSLGS